MALALKDIHDFGNIDFLAKQIVEGFITGMHKSPFHGFSVEFAEHRQYNTGESTRHLDWKAFSKTDRLYIKQFEEETNLRAMLVLDTSSSMYYPLPEKKKIKFGALALAAIAYMLQKQRDAVGLTTFDSDIRYQKTPKATALHLQELFKQLSYVISEPNYLNKKSVVVEILHRLAESLHRRSMVVVVSDFLMDNYEVEALYEALRHLTFRHHEVVLIQLIDYQTEVKFEFDDREHVFIDMETGEKIKLNPYEIKTMMQQESELVQNELKLLCAKLKMDYATVDVNLPFKQVFLPFLRKRAKLF